MNRRAPYEIDLGPGPDVIRYAQLLLTQNTTIPVFLKRDPFVWEYVGDFRAVKYDTDTSNLYPAKNIRRNDAIAVLYLDSQPIPTDSNVADDPTISQAAALEGGLALATHLRRERHRQLIDAKRRSYRAEHGRLSCQACKITETDLPPSIGEGCFEVHHTQPIGQREVASVTTLDDLALLCANCHRMIHRSSPIPSINKLSELLANAAQQRH